MSQTLNSSPNPTPIQAPKCLVIAFRESRLAMWQALHVQDCFKKPHPDCDIQTLGITPAHGGQILDKASSKVSGKRLTGARCSGFDSNAAQVCIKIARFHHLC